MEKKSKLKRIILIILIIIIILLLVSCSSPMVKEYIKNEKNPTPSIIFSDVVVNGIKDSTVLEDERTLNFTATLKDKGEKYKIEYKVSNNSKKLKSKAEIVCTKDNDFLIVTNEFDTEKILNVGETRKGTLTIELKKVAMEEQKMKVKCIIKEIEIK